MMFSLNQLTTLYLLLGASGSISTSLANPISIPREVSSSSNQTSDITTTPPKVNAVSAAAADTYYCPSTRTSYSRARVLANVLSFPYSGATAGASGYPHSFHNNEGFHWDPATGICDDDSRLIEMPIFPDGHLYAWNSSPRENPGPARAIYVMSSGGYAALCGVISHMGTGSGYFEKCRL